MFSADTNKNLVLKTNTEENNQSVLIDVPKYRFMSQETQEPDQQIMGQQEGKSFPG